MVRTAPSASVSDVPEPISVIAGVGCRRGTDADEIIALVEKTLAAAGLSRASLLAIASLDRKADEAGLLAAAERFGVPLKVFPAAQLEAGDSASKIQRLVGVVSVAEAVARRAGPLLQAKRKSSHATCALGACCPDFDLAAFGQAVPVSIAAMAASRSLTSSAGP